MSMLEVKDHVINTDKITVIDPVQPMFQGSSFGLTVRFDGGAPLNLQFDTEDEAKLARAKLWIRLGGS